MQPRRGKPGGFDTKCNLMLNKVRLSAGSGFCGGRAAAARPEKERKNNRGNGGEMQLAASAVRFEPRKFCCCFLPPPRNGDRLPWMEQPLCLCNYSPPLLCVQMSADCLMDPAPAICVLRAADLADGLIQHYAEPLSPVMLLMAEVYNAYVVVHVLHTCRQGCLFPVLHIAESTVLDIHLSNVERPRYSNMCCSSLNNAATTTFT